MSSAKIPSPETEVSVATSRLERFVDAGIWGSRIVVTLLTVFAAFALYFVVTVPLAFGQQFAFATICFLCALGFRRLQGQYATLVMIMLSIVASGRYMFWRLTETTY